MKSPVSRRGFSFVETIVYVGIASMVMAALLPLLMRLFGSRDRTEMRTDIQQNLRFAMERIVTATESAQGVLSASNGFLGLAMSGASIHPTSFTLSGTTIYLREGFGAIAAITDPSVRVTEMRFRALPTLPTLLWIHLSASGSTLSGGGGYTPGQTLETAVSLRQ